MIRIMAERIWIVISTVDSEAAAAGLAAGSVRAGVAACAQVEAPIISHYTWKGQVEETREWRICFKIGETKREQLMSWIRTHHPYEVPEIIGWEARAADPDYADWVAAT